MFFFCLILPFFCHSAKGASVPSSLQCAAEENPLVSTGSPSTDESKSSTANDLVPPQRTKRKESLNREAVQAVDSELGNIERIALSSVGKPSPPQRSKKRWDTTEESPNVETFAFESDALVECVGRDGLQQVTLSLLDDVSSKLTVEEKTGQTVDKDDLSLPSKIPQEMLPLAQMEKHPSVPFCDDSSSTQSGVLEDKGLSKDIDTHSVMHSQTLPAVLLTAEFVPPPRSKKDRSSPRLNKDSSASKAQSRGRSPAPKELVVPLRKTKGRSHSCEVSSVSSNELKREMKLGTPESLKPSKENRSSPLLAEDMSATGAQSRGRSPAPKELVVPIRRNKGRSQSCEVSPESSSESKKEMKLVTPESDKPLVKENRSSLLTKDTSDNRSRGRSPAPKDLVVPMRKKKGRSQSCEVSAVSSTGSSSEIRQRTPESDKPPAEQPDQKKTDTNISEIIAGVKMRKKRADLPVPMPCVKRLSGSFIDDMPAADKAAWGKAVSEGLTNLPVPLPRLKKRLSGSYMDVASSHTESQSYTVEAAVDMRAKVREGMSNLPVPMPRAKKRLSGSFLDDSSSAAESDVSGTELTAKALDKLVSEGLSSLPVSMPRIKKRLSGSFRDDVTSLEDSQLRSIETAVDFEASKTRTKEDLARLPVPMPRCKKRLSGSFLDDISFATESESSAIKPPESTEAMVKDVAKGLSTIPIPMPRMKKRLSGAFLDDTSPPVETLTSAADSSVDLEAKEKASLPVPMPRSKRLSGSFSDGSPRTGSPLSSPVGSYETQDSFLLKLDHLSDEFKDSSSAPVSAEAFESSNEREIKSELSVATAVSDGETETAVLLAGDLTHMDEETTTKASAEPVPEATAVLTLTEAWTEGPEQTVGVFAQTKQAGPSGEMDIREPGKDSGVPEEMPERKESVEVESEGDSASADER